MNNNLTELVFILDCSGSMHGLESDTIGGFNSMLEKQRREEGSAYISTVLFNSECKVIHDRANIKTVREMTERDYCTGGSTALLDALGGAIHHIGNVHKYARSEDVPAHTLFVIITDGMENASRRYTASEVKQMIEREKTQRGWEFMFLGANIDAVETAHLYGFSPDQAVDYCSDSEGTARNYEAIGKAVSALRKTGYQGSDWKTEIERGYRRKKGR